MSNNQRTTSGKVRTDAMARAREAWDLRVVGLPWDEVARRVGFNDKSAAYRAVKRYCGTVPEHTREELRQLWRQRLETLWRLALRDASEGKAGAVTSGVRVAGSALALDGLSAPAEVVVHNPTTAEIEAWVARLMSEQHPDVIEADILGLEDPDSPYYQQNPAIEQGETP